MKLTEFGAPIVVALALHFSSVSAKNSHRHLNTLERKHLHLHRDVHISKAERDETGEARDVSAIVKRGGQCQFPTDAGLVSVAPNAMNAGWAMSPDQPCTPNSYCPYACPPGQMMAQWDPQATSYPSMNGGLYCDKDGKIKKPFPDKPYCMTGLTNVGALNKASGHVAICQTVLPGNEAMLIPTGVNSWSQLTVPTLDYWCQTAAHFYINPPGVSCEDACVWGTLDKPIGNWSPYVAGANMDKSGNTFVKLGWNPIYLEPKTPFRDVMPNWGVEIVCDGGGCNGLPCAIDPTKNKVNEMVGNYDKNGAGGGSFCVVTVPKGVNANYVITDGKGGSGGGTGGTGGTGGGGNSASNKDVVSPSSNTPANPSPTPPISTSSSSPVPSNTPTPSSASSSSSPSSSSSSSASYSFSSSSSSSLTSTDGTSVMTASYPSFEYSPHVLAPNRTAMVGVTSSSSVIPLTTVSTGPSATMSPIASATPTSAGAPNHANAAGLSLGVLTAFLVLVL